ncbi:hypothetical protein LX95_02683 [Mesonia algae]|uniref:histidine kinase n=1 Tax=Mesonia algae TaxID=213248 RepID=A0A2W7HZJ8_9FLAO|nr:response regulator [Mesonia algae]PZW37891.1 hypothetical protein LX95_02683 [Mesonia algae]
MNTRILLFLLFSLLALPVISGNINYEYTPSYSSQEKTVDGEKASIQNVQTDSLAILTENYYESATGYFQKKELELSFEYAKLTYELAQRRKDYSMQVKSLNLLSIIYERENNLEKALECLKKVNSVKNAFLKDVTGKTILNDETFPVVEGKILELEKTNLEQEKSLKFNQLAIVLSVLLITILSLLTLSLYKNNNLRAGANKLLQKKNKQLFEAKEKAEQANKIKENFLSTITHELRTPIYAITGLTYLLLQENPNKDQEEHLNSLKYSGEHLLSLINNILDLNKLSAKKVKKIDTDFNLRLRMDDFYKSFKKLARDKNVAIHMNIDEQIPDKLNGDMLKISQVLMNLVSNAIKFSEDGDVWINLSLLKEDKDEAYVRFEIVDNGVGIEQKYHKSIFKNFNQGDDETSVTYGGTGLGLPIVKNLLLFLGSKIYFESEKDSGSKFYFDISFKKVLRSIENKQQTETNLSVLEDDIVKVLHNKKILIVDDNKLNQKITEKILLRKNIICEVAENGKVALDLVNKFSYDLILMDIHMPVMDGIEATEIIRKNDSVTPIIALTAVSLDDKDDQFFHHGFTDIIPKPYKTELFYQKIYKVLKLAQQNS